MTTCTMHYILQTMQVIHFQTFPCCGRAIRVDAWLSTMTMYTTHAVHSADHASSHLHTFPCGRYGSPGSPSSLAAASGATHRLPAAAFLTSLAAVQTIDAKGSQTVPYYQRSKSALVEDALF